MGKYKTLLKISFYILLGIVTHYEANYIGGIKIAQVWKLLLLMGLYFTVIKYPVNRIAFLALVLSFKFLIIADYQYGFGEQVGIFGRSLTYPIILHFILSLNYDIRKLTRGLYEFSIFLILASSLYLIGIVEPNVAGYDMSLLGIEESGFIGFFQKSHYAGISLSAALVYITWYNYKVDQKYALINYLFIALGLFLVYKTFVRTPLILSVLGLMMIYFDVRSIRRVSRMFVFGIGIIILAYTMYENNEAFKMRMQGKTIYKEDRDTDIDDFTSGRSKIIMTNLESWQESNFFNQLFGLGVEKSQEMMYDKIGLKLVSHNGYINYLIYSGIIGLMLFLYFLFKLYKVVRIKGPYYKLGITFFVMLLVLNLFQGDNWFFFDVYLAVITAIAILYRKQLIIKYREKLKLEKENEKNTPNRANT